MVNTLLKISRDIGATSATVEDISNVWRSKEFQVTSTYSTSWGYNIIAMYGAARDSNHAVRRKKFAKAPTRISNTSPRINKETLCATCEGHTQHRR